MEATVTLQQAALATVQTQVEAQAARAAETQAAALATVQVAEAKLVEEQAKSAAYSRIVRANQLANNALLELDRHPQAALLLAIESLRMQRENGEAPLSESVQRLRSILGATGGVPLRTEQETTALVISADEHWVAAGGETGAVRIWDLQRAERGATLATGTRGTRIRPGLWHRQRFAIQCGRRWNAAPLVGERRQRRHRSGHYRRHKSRLGRAAATIVRVVIVARRQPTGSGGRGRRRAVVGYR